jgi:hypothetical protein
MAQMARAVAPIEFEAFEEHILYAVLLSKTVKERLQDLLRPLASSSPDAADILKGLEP